MNIKKIQKCFPCKRLGQNFLINKNVIKNIIKAINPNKKEVLVEIGPGLAALTNPMCQLLEELVVVEVDSNLLNLLKKNTFYSKLIVFCQDALTFSYLNLFYKKNQLMRIFGNLPYNISTSLIIYLFKQIEVIQDMHFMLQKEVAERLIASPGKKLYGRLSIIAQYYCTIEILLKVAPENFRPIPKVYSMFVNLTPHKNPPYFVHDINILSNITNTAFGSRRKILRHSLGSLFSKETLIKLKVDPKERAENISISQYCRLSNYLYNISNDINVKNL